MSRLLVVEPDPRVSSSLSIALLWRGFEVQQVSSGRDALNTAPADVVLLDLAIPDLDGIEVARHLQRRSDVVRIVSITPTRRDGVLLHALTMHADRLAGSRLRFTELLSLLEQTCRRSSSLRRNNSRDVVRLGNIAIDVDARKVAVGDTPIPLTRKEFDVLTLLARDAGRLVPREYILAMVWNALSEPPARTLDVHIASLRGKLGNPRLVETVRGVGYRLAVELCL